jgi:hypothetical protein
MNEWKITYMTDYPYSDSVIVEARTENSAWKKFEKKVGFKQNEFCSIEKL